MNSQDKTEQLENEKRSQNERISLGRKVEKTIKTSGWKEIIEPLIDKMIKDVLGGKFNGRWASGEAATGKRLDFLMGYKQAMIDLHNRVHGYVDAIKHAEGNITDIEKEENAGYSVPMADTGYAAEEQKL